MIEIEDSCMQTKEQASSSDTEEDTEKPKKTSKLNKADVTPEEENQESNGKKEKLHIPLTIYYIKDLLREFVNHKYFVDSLLSVFAMLSVSIVAPFYPVLLLIPILVLLFVLSRLHPLLGLMALLLLSFPMYMYHMPLLAWTYVFFFTAALLVGYRYSDAITVAYAIVALALSPLGYMLDIPVFIIGVLYLGFKRSIAVTIVSLLLIATVSGMTGISNTAPFIYNQAGFQATISNNPGIAFLTPSKTAIAPTLATFGSAISSATSGFINAGSGGGLFNAMGIAVSAAAYGIETTAVQILVWLAVVFAISTSVVKSRSAYKGTEASLYAFVILAPFLFFQYTSGLSFKVFALAGFALTPLIIFLLETYDVNVVRTLDVMKKDFLGKFGEAFEDLTSGAHETLDDIGDYVETKKELQEAILEPIEHREIAGAYNIKPAKGILLFGPPGTGKTLMMRALSNEIRAKFFYVKTSSIVSPYSGESIQMLSKIFTEVRTHPPAVLFFDEIDGIAAKREKQTDEVSRQLLSALLAEMDGFQKINGVVIVGSTNVPQMIDPSILRPGRFDKIIYMPLPDKNARIAVFKYYSKKYPMSPDLDFEKLADATQRFSNADIANVCSEAARHAAEIALRRSQILKISTEDLMHIVKLTKPSTSLSAISEYERFRLDFERRAYRETEEETKKGVAIEDVAGLEEAKKALYEALEVPMLHPQLAKEYDVRSINGILLLGPPGVGKSMLMRAVANEIGDYRMISVSGADISKEGYEKAIEKIKEIFDRVKENAPAILFIDEVDSLIPSRENGGLVNVQLTAEFLREFDTAKEVEGIVIVGSTNRPDAIDSAMIRPGRFDKLIFVGPPDSEAREELFKKNLEKAPMEGKIDFAHLAQITEGYTGADIGNICREVKMKALESKIGPAGKGSVTIEALEQAIKDTKPTVYPGVLTRYKMFISLHGRD